MSQMSKRVNCPHCHYVLDDDDMHRQDIDLWALAPREETADIDCPICGEHFYISASYTPDYQTFLTEDECMSA